MATWAVGKLAARLLGLPPSLVLTKAQYDTVDIGVGSGQRVGWGWWGGDGELALDTFVFLQCEQATSSK